MLFGLINIWALVGAIFLTAALYVLTGIVTRALGRIPFYWKFNPANTFSLIVSDEDKSGDGQKGGGNLVDLLHAIPGSMLVKKRDPMDWEVVDGIEARHRGFIYRNFGVLRMDGVLNSFFRKARFNVEKRNRFAWEEEIDEKHPGEARLVAHGSPQTLTKVSRTQNVYFSGELTASIKEADTADQLGIDIEFDFTYRRRFPVRSVLRLADPAAFLTSRVMNFLNQVTVRHDSDEFIGGEDTQERRNELVDAIQGNNDFMQEVLEEIGFEIVKVSLRSITMQEKWRLLLEKKVEAKKLAQADIIRAKGQRRSKMLNNEADANRVETVIKPAAENERTVAVRASEAYENNKTVTTYAPGTPTMLPLQK